MTAQKQNFPKQVILILAIIISLTATAKKPDENSLTAHTPTDTIVTGIVKDVHGKPIANAKVTSVAGDVYTNIDGLFSITLQTGNIIPQSLFFSYDTLMPVVRSYHPVMDNAMYDIVLEPKKCCLKDLWISTLANNKNLPSLNFTKDATKLTPEIKAALKEIAATLKDEPEAKITMTAYSDPTKARQKIADKRLQIITEYLTEQEGISSDRISTEKKNGQGDGNSVEFKKQQ